jgi:hypothetical protein
LAVWQARGRRAWEEAEAAAERATGTLAPLLIVPPPLAGLPVPVLSPTPAFAIPPGLEPTDCGSEDGTTLASRESTKVQLQRLAAQLATTWPALAAVLAAAAKEIEQELEAEAGSAAAEDGVGAAEGAANRAAATFTSSDPLVGDLANAIEARQPGRVVGVNVSVYDSAGREQTDYDIELEDNVIEVKSGRGTGIGSQVTRILETTGKQVIVYGPKLGRFARAEAESRGAVVFTSEAALLEYLAGQ